MALPLKRVVRMPVRRQRKNDEAFQMAPMIDMVFLLLVFFMTVSTMAKDSRPELELAISTTAAVPEVAPPRDIITVKQAGDSYNYYWSNKLVDFDELSGFLEGRMTSGGEELLLRAEPDLPWKTWDRLIRICREFGVSDIVFATFED